MFQGVVKTYKVCAVEKDGVTVIWKFVALSKAGLKHDSQQGGCGQLANSRCNLGVSFLFTTRQINASRNVRVRAI